MLGWIKFIVKTVMFLLVIMFGVIGYKYYSIYVPYYDFIYNHLYFDEVKSIYAGRCASLAYTRGLSNKSLHSPVTFDDIIISPYVSFGRWMLDHKDNTLGKEMSALIPHGEKGWDSLAKASQSVYVKYIYAGDTKYRLQFVVSDLKDAYVEKLEFDGPVNDYYGIQAKTVDEWAQNAFDIRSERGALYPLHGSR